MTDQRVSEARAGVIAAVRLYQGQVGATNAYIDALEHRIESLEQERDRVALQPRTILERENADLRATNDRLIGLLREHEWCQYAYNPEGTGQYCPSCHSFQEDGHSADCQWAELLATKEANDA